MDRLPWQMERGILIRQEAETDPTLGCRPEERTTEELLNFGVICVNKPKGPTSPMTVDYIKKILKLKKAGHGGALDPGVTGVLPVATERATRIMQSLLKAGKEYVCIMHLHKDTEEEKIRKVAEEFKGKISQLPPVRSAVKRQMRERNIYYFDLLEIDGRDTLFKVGCQAGTYVRKLCLHPDTKIITPNGLTPISKFYKMPQKVQSFHRKIVQKIPSAVQKIRSPKEATKITMSSGISFIATPDHELLKSTQEGYKMTEIRKLRTNDYIARSRNFTIANQTMHIPDLLDDDYLIPKKELKQMCKNALITKYGSIRSMHNELKLDRKAFLRKSDNAITIRHLKLAGIYEQIKHRIRTYKTQKGNIIHLDKLTPNLLYLLGLIASDGNNTREMNTARFTRVKFHNSCEELISEFAKKYATIFPTIKFARKKIKNIWQIDTTNSLFATIASSLGIKSPHKSSDISPILNLEPKLIKQFLKGYFDGDGTAYIKKKQRSGYYTNIRIFSVGYENAKAIHHMLTKLGIPNKIFDKKGYYIISLESLAAKHKFIREIGSNHPSKQQKLKEIGRLKTTDTIDDHQYIGLHYKSYVKKKKGKLRKLGGNLSRIITGNKPVTRKFYKKAANLVKLPPLDDLIIEKINKIETTPLTGYVYDMTVPETHNFLIETGFVSSNCHDFGQKLRTGAHMAELIRTKAGPFTDKEWVTLQDLEDAYAYYKQGKDRFLRHCIKPAEFGVKHLAKIWVQDSAVDTICHGATLKMPGVARLHDNIEPDELIAVMTLKDEIICLGRARKNSAQLMEDTKGIAVKPESVLMKTGTYKTKN